MKSVRQSAFVTSLLIGGCACAQVSAPPSAASGPGGPIVTAGCIQAVLAHLTSKGFFHEGSHKPGVEKLGSEKLEELRRKGVPMGELSAPSLISSPSRYGILHLRNESQGQESSDCPMHELYIVYHQGGFVPQPPQYYGPVRASGT